MNDFIAEVAARTSTEPEQVSQVLERHGVRPWVAPPPTPAVLIEKVEFSGRTAAGGVERDFNFEWELGPGVHALSSVDNDVGKSSVLEVIRWLLSGRDGVDRTVRAMIERAALSFRIGPSAVRVEVEGERHAESGSLSVDGSEQQISHASFEATMDELMLERLGLRPLVQWQKYPGSEDGHQTRRGWPAFVPALFLPAHGSSALLGEEPRESAALLQVFLGLPWFTTERQAAFALQTLGQQERDVKRRSDRDRKADEVALSQAEAELQQAQRELGQLPDTRTANAQLESASAAVTSATRATLAAQAVADERGKELAAAEEVVLEAQRSLRMWRETVAAGAVFSELKAEVCPRCELAIGSERREAEVEGHLCMVCNRPQGSPEVEAAQAQAAAEARLSEVEEARDTAKQRAQNAGRQAQAAQADLEQARSRQRAAEPAADLLERRAAKRVQVARAEGKLEELRRRRADLPAPEASADAPVLRAASEESKERMRDKQLFENLNQEILGLAQRFGMRTVDAVRLDRRAQLPVTKGPVTEPFGELTPSEKLRMRVATTIALLRIAAAGGPARHPGLLVIDSIAAEEVAVANLQQMLSALVGLSDDIDRLQVLVATTRTEVVAEALPAERIRFVPQGEWLR